MMNGKVGLRESEKERERERHSESETMRERYKCLSGIIQICAISVFLH